MDNLLDDLDQEEKSDQLRRLRMVVGPSSGSGSGGGGGVARTRQLSIEAKKKSLSSKNLTGFGKHTRHPEDV